MSHSHPHPIDPVNLDPIPPLVDSYTYHSAPYSDGASGSGSGSGGFSAKDDENAEQGWIMGIDEAGRGPVLGPMVYAAAYCPLSFKPTLEEIGFDDSKALSADTRQSLWESFDLHPPLCYSSTTLSPQSISSNMLRKVPVNLNRQAEDATIGLIRSALERGVNVKECFVDALGPAPQWQSRLSALFPTISFTVCPKADSLFKIVGAASIIAKVTRDRYVHQWTDPEDLFAAAAAASERKRQRGADECVEREIAKVAKEADSGEEEAGLQQRQRGSGYPSDPKTQAYLKDSLDPVFGYKGIVRFSWATVKVLLEKQGVECKWIDDVSQPSAASWFGAEADNGRPKMWRDLGVSSVGEL